MQSHPFNLNTPVRFTAPKSLKGKTGKVHSFFNDPDSYYEVLVEMDHQEGQSYAHYVPALNIELETIHYD